MHTVLLLTGALTDGTIDAWLIQVINLLKCLDKSTNLQRRTYVDYISIHKTYSCIDESRSK